MSKLPASQKKKLRQKQRKAEARAKMEAENKNEEANTNNLPKAGKRQVKAVDPDPHGAKLLQVEDPLVEATKYLKLLQKNSTDSLETHLLSFEVNMRKQKILLALKALKNLLRLDAESPETHRCLIRFFHKVNSMPTPGTDTERLVCNVLEAERPSISQLHEKSLMEANMSYLKRHEDSLVHKAAVAEMLHLLEPSKKLEAIKLIEDSSDNIVSRNGALTQVGEWTLKECVAVHKLLENVLFDKDAATRWKLRCAEYFPYSTYFEGSRNSAVSNSYLKGVFQNSENGCLHHTEEAVQSADSVEVNGKFNDLKI